MVRFREDEFSAIQGAAALNLLMQDDGEPNQGDMSCIGEDHHEPMPRRSEASHVRQAMEGFVHFGSATTWMCEEDNEMYALLEIICEAHPTGVWILIHDFLEPHL